MSSVAFIVASLVGAVALMLGAWRHRVNVAIWSVIGSFGVTVIVWLIDVPSHPGRTSSLLYAALALSAAILIPGGAGGAMAQWKTKNALTRGFIVLIPLWVAFAFIGIFAVCQLDPRCEI